MTITNQDKRKYAIIALEQRIILDGGETTTVDCSEVAIRRVYSKNRVLDFFAVFFMIIVYLAFVFFETAGSDEGKSGLIRVSYRVKNPQSEKPLNLVILNSAFLNVEKDAQADESYTLNRAYYIAHIASIILYTALIAALFFALSYFGFNHGDVGWGMVCGGLGVCLISLGVYSTIKSVKNLKSLQQYMQNYYNGTLQGY